MIKKDKEKIRAIQLRKEGKTYSEILSQIKVAKSTLSLWLREVGLSKKQKQLITAKKLIASKRGGEAKRQQRILKQNAIYTASKKQIISLTDKERFLIGVSLYWGEGSKEKSYSPGSAFRFANSDSNMIKFLLSWLLTLNVTKERISFDIYIHQNHKYRINEVIGYWSKLTSFPKSSFKVYFKKNILSTKRKNTEPDSYFGVLRIYVKESSGLVREVDGWVQAIMSCL